MATPTGRPSTAVATGNGVRREDAPVTASGPHRDGVVTALERDKPAVGRLGSSPTRAAADQR